MISTKFGSFTLDFRRRPRSPGPGVANSGSGGLHAIIGEHWSLRRRRRGDQNGMAASFRTAHSMDVGNDANFGVANNKSSSPMFLPSKTIPFPINGIDEEGDEKGGENFVDRPNPSSAGTGSSACGKGGIGESDTHSLDRRKFCQRANTTKEIKLKNNGKCIKGKEEHGGFDSPYIALLDPCSSSAQNSATSASHRFASFLSRRLKRTKSHPKLQNGIAGNGQQPSSSEQQREHLLLLASLGPTALRTDQQQQQQRNQPLSLYLPDGCLFEEQLKASRSFESLVLFGQSGGHTFLQKSPSESDHHRLLLCPIPPSSQSQQFLHNHQQQPSLQSNSMICLENGGGGQNWMDSSNSSSLRGRMHSQLNRDQLRRVDNSLSVWVLEAKGVPPKRKFFCEISLDQVVRARTSAKAMTDGICFWGEQFDFQQLPPSQLLCIDLFREAEPIKKRRSGKSNHDDLQNLIGLVRIPMAELSGRQPIEKWYPVSSGDGQPAAISSSSSSSSSATAADGHPSLRLKARYQSVQVLPLRAYGQLREFLRANSLPLCAAFEPILGVKVKEDFANSLVRILHVERRAPEALAELAMAEVLSQENDHLLFRGNSLATKAVEAYMKCVASDYLQMALGEFVRQLLCSELSCEVDPLRLTNTSGSGPTSTQLEKNRQQLMRQVEMGWRRILACQEFFPYPLRLLFAGVRQRLEQAGRTELADNLLSSSIFLRFFCPAILSPSLFGFVGEYPTGQAARNLTLIAKSLQTLANFTRFGGKEAYMEFMNTFVEREWRNMHQFLSQISASCPRHCQTGELQSKAIDGQLDFGKELSLLSSYLRENWTTQLHERNKGGPMGQLWGVLMGISAWDHCDPDEEEEEEGGQRYVEGDEAEGMNHYNGHNPPSDYENNNAIGGNGHRDVEKRMQNLAQSQAKILPIPSRRAILPPKPIGMHSVDLAIANGPNSAPPLPLAPPHFTPSAAAHLHSSDDYVLSSALANLRASQQMELGGGRLKSTIHLYDETPVPHSQQNQIHLYDEVAGLSGNTNEAESRAMAKGIMTAQRGVASHEAQRRELHTPRMVQRGMRPPKEMALIGADEADDESESDGHEKVQGGDDGLEKGVGMAKDERSTSLGAASFRQAHLPYQQRRPPRKRSSQRNGAQQKQQKANSIDGTNAVHFDSSSASAISQQNRRPSVGKTTTTTLMGGQPIPSSGYQSQLNSSSSSYSSSSGSASSAASSNSASPIDAQNEYPLGQQQQPPQSKIGVVPIPSVTTMQSNVGNPPPSAFGHHQTASSMGYSSSASSSSAYSSLSPSNQPPTHQNASPQFPMMAKPPRSNATPDSHQIIGQQWPSPRQRIQNVMGSPFDGMATFNRGGGYVEQQRPATTANSAPSYQSPPKPRLNPSCWSIPGSSSSGNNNNGCSVPPRQAFVGSSPGDPLGAFIRCPSMAQSSNNGGGGPLPQKFPTAAELHNWPNNQQYCPGGNGPGGLYTSASVDLGIGIGQPHGAQHRRESGQTHSMGQSMAALGEFELIETQRRQIAELTRENAALRRELDTVRAVSHSNLRPTIGGGTKYPNESI